MRFQIFPDDGSQLLHGYVMVWIPFRQQDFVCRPNDVSNTKGPGTLYLLSLLGRCGVLGIAKMTIIVKPLTCYPNRNKIIFVGLGTSQR
jgi:hypothetical protein